MIRRNLFFFLDKLQIKRGERIAVTALFMTLIMLSGLAIILEPKDNYDPGHYAELERIFFEKSKAQELENAEILARYNPEMDDVYFPKVESHIVDQPVEGQESFNRPDIAQSDSVININKATSDQLQLLPGIGPAYAERIIEWREKNGRFTSIEQLLEIRGIGERRLEQIIPYISLGEDENNTEGID